MSKPIKVAVTNKINTDSLITPVYIDTNILLDLIASIEGGFSTVDKVTTSSTTSTTNDKTIKGEAGAQIGISNMLNLVKVNLSGSLQRKEDRGDSQTNQTDKYQTYGSLLYRLRAYLGEKGLLKTFDGSSESWDAIETPDFVELHGYFRPDPVVENFKIFYNMVPLLEIVNGQPLRTKSEPKLNPKQGTKQGPKPEGMSLSQFVAIIDRIVEDAARSPIKSLVIDHSKDIKQKTVISIFTEYLRDPSLTEIAYKEYWFLGRVVRKLSSDQDEPIDLLRGSVLGGFGLTHLDQITSAFSGIQGFKFPKFETQITTPALQVLPIAIYV